MGPMDAIKPMSQMAQGLGSWAATPLRPFDGPAFKTNVTGWSFATLAAPLIGISRFQNDQSSEATQKTLVSVEDHTRTAAPKDDDLGLGIGIGVTATLLLVGAARAVLRRQANRERMHIEDFISRETKKAMAETDVGRQMRERYKLHVYTGELNTAQQRFSPVLVSLINTMSVFHQLDRRAESPLGQTGPSAMLGSYWQEANAGRLKKLMDWVTVGAYYKQFASAAIGLMSVVELLEQDPDRSSVTSILIALHKITLAQMALQSAYQVEKDQIELLELAQDHAADSVAILSLGVMRKEANVLDQFGLLDIREQARMLKKDIETSMRSGGTSY